MEYAGVTMWSMSASYSYLLLFVTLPPVLWSPAAQCRKLR